MSILILIAALAALTLGAEVLVRGASLLALRSGVSPLFVGLTVIGFGTSSPELGASLSATLAGSTEVSVGNVVGSNIFNVAVILGLTALVRPIRVRLAAVRRDLLVAVGAALLPVCSLWFDGRIPREMGALMLGLLALYLTAAYRSARRSSRADRELARSEVDDTLAIEPDPAEARGRVWVNLGLVLLGLVLLTGGSHFFVSSAMQLARAIGVSHLVIGLTVVSAGTSMPELVTSIIAARRGNPDIAIGNVIGSSIFNLLGILGASSVVAPQLISRSVLLVDVPVMFVLSLALLPLIRSGSAISRLEGAALLLTYLGYGIWLALRGS